MEAAVAPVSQAPRRYRFEMILAFVLYAVALFGRVYLLKNAVDPMLRVAITVSPILPILFAAFVIYRFYRRVDEFQRMRLLKIMAISGGVTAVTAASWSFLEDVGAPPLTNFGVVFILAGTFSLVDFLYRLEDAASERRIGKTGRSLSWFSASAAAASAAWLAVATIAGLPWIIPLAVLVAAAMVLIFVALWIGPSSALG
jgi:hypothetical protein